MGSALPVERLARTIDQVVNLDISGYGVIDALYAAAIAHYGGPLTLKAATALTERVKPGDWFCVTTGWLMPGLYPYGETDGPIGAAILGHALGIGVGARMLVVTEDRMVPAVTAACRGAGLNVMSETDLDQAPRPPHVGNPYCLVVPFPFDDTGCIGESVRVFDRYQPKAMVAIEKNGPNREGRYCMVDGADNSECVIKAGRLFEDAARRGVLTIGIGDRGNEIGFGAIADTPRKLLPYGESATDSTTVDVLVTACVSNWGAAGIAAALALVLGKPEALHDADTESRMLHDCIRAGAVDGMSCRPIPRTDGMSEGAQVSIATLLNEIVDAPALTRTALFSTPIE